MPTEQQDATERSYFMTYRHGMNPFNIKGFKVQGDLRVARNRAFKHGQIMGYKNIWVFPMYANLLEDERGQTSENAVSQDIGQKPFQKDVIA